MNSVLLPADADVVVIGAGAFGLSTAYHLTALGAGRVLVLDQFAPASQTSPRAAGLFKLVQADPTLTELARLSVEIVTRFERATGVPIPHVRSGSLLLARTAAHAAMIRAEAAQSRQWGVEVEEIAPTALHDDAPYLEQTGILAAIDVPGDIYIAEPSTLLAAYQTAGERLGMTVIGETAVTAIRMERGRVAGVVTPRGEVRTPVVVDAAGAWSPIVGTLAGVTIPVAPVRHQLRITAPLGGVEPGHRIARIVDASVYLRPARGGLMVGGMERDPLPLDPRDTGPSFTMADVPLDGRVLDRMTTNVRDQVPSLVDAPIAEMRGGLFTMTPDAHFLAGPVPEATGFWAATGCNGSGFSLSPGIGRVLAEWITGGSPSIDCSTIVPDRFTGRSADRATLIAAGIEQYANYYTPWPVFHLVADAGASPISARH